MSIKFNKNEMKAAPYGSLKFGDSFLPADYANYVQIKVQPFKCVRSDEDKEMYNAVDVSNGSFDWYGDTDEVFPVNATLTLDK